MPTELTFDFLQAAFPKEGLFEGKEWLSSPEPFRLAPSTVREIVELGPVLHRFLKAADRFYTDSHEGRGVPWLAHLLDRGKPREVIALGLEESFRKDVPEVVRPDLLLASDGLFLTEIDSLPGGMGVLAWLNEVFAGAGWEVLGGGRGMIEGFARVVLDGPVIFSRESEGYRPEMEWLMRQIDSGAPGGKRVLAESDFNPSEFSSSVIYRFFELWDLENVQNSRRFLDMAVSGGVRFTPPLKAYLEEKLWLALVWNPALQKAWIERLGFLDFTALQRHVPQGWVVDPEPIPYFAEYPGLGIQTWQEIKAFTQKERRLVLKISGFSETAWGSRGVYVGHDLSSGEWGAAVDRALSLADRNPFILQRFHQAKVVEHPYWDPLTGKRRSLRGRVRLCPYFFRKGDSVELAGVLATICPEDKKIIHGMRDSILVPCVAG
jgi:hypothetical protein